ncbi:MATE family efflux transporter [Mycoplasmatota bacterium WC30]
MKKIYDLTEGSILKKLLLVALPVLLTTIAQMAYNLTDMFWIGRVDQIGMIETDAVTAVGTASYITWFAFGFILIAKIGASVKISHAVGEKKPHKIDVFSTNGLFLELIFGLFFSAMVLIFKEEFLSIFNIENQRIIDYALMYIPIIGGFLFFQFLNNGFSAINQGLGQTKINLIILAIGFLLNIILDPLLILGLGMGIRGAAIATVFSQAVTFVIFFLVYKRHNPNIKVFKLKNINLKAIKEIIRVGLPVGIHSMLFTSISIYIAVMVFRYGEHVVAAQRIGSQIEQLTWMIGSGFQTAITVYVGQNFGAKAFGRIKKGILYISSILVPYSFLVAGLIYFKSEWLMRIFVDDPITIANGVKYLRIISIAQIFMMLEAIGAGLFNGLGKSIVPSLTGVFGNIARIPMAILFAVSLNEIGIWWALNISDIFKGGILLIASIYIFTRLDRIKVKNNIAKQESMG